MKLGITALGRRVARAARRRRPGIAILMYHRVAEPPADPYGLAVAPDAFAEQMEVLARVGPVISLASAREAIERGRVQGRDARHARRRLLLVLDLALSELSERGLGATDSELLRETECSLAVAHDRDADRARRRR
jgi:hypothetical protein